MKLSSLDVLLAEDDGRACCGARSLDFLFFFFFVNLWDLRESLGLAGAEGRGGVEGSSSTIMYSSGLDEPIGDRGFGWLVRASPKSLEEEVEMLA